MKKRIRFQTRPLVLAILEGKPDGSIATEILGVLHEKGFLTPGIANLLTMLKQLCELGFVRKDRVHLRTVYYLTLEGKNELTSFREELTRAAVFLKIASA